MSYWLTVTLARLNNAPDGALFPGILRENRQLYLMKAVKGCQPSCARPSKTPSESLLMSWSRSSKTVWKDCKQSWYCGYKDVD